MLRARGGLPKSCTTTGSSRRGTGDTHWRPPKPRQLPRTPASASASASDTLAPQSCRASLTLAPQSCRACCSSSVCLSRAAGGRMVVGFHSPRLERSRSRCCSPRGRSPRHRQRWAPFATRPTSGRRSANSCAQTRRPTILTQQPHPRSPATPTLPRRTSMPNFGSALRITGWPVRWAQRFLQANSTGSWRVLPYTPPASLRSGSCAGSRRTPLVSPPALWRLKPFGPLRRCKRHASSFCARRVRFFVRMRRRPQRHRSIASGCRVPRACPQRRGCGRVGRRPCCTCLSC